MFSIDRELLKCQISWFVSEQYSIQGDHIQMYMIQSGARLRYLRSKACKDHKEIETNI